MSGKVIGVCDCPKRHKILYVYERDGAIMLRGRLYIGSTDKDPRGDWTTSEAVLGDVVTYVCPAGRTYTIYSRELIDELKATKDSTTRSLPLWPEDPRRWPAAATRRIESDAL